MCYILHMEVSFMTERQKQAILKKLQAEMNKMAKTRDTLRDLLDELDDEHDRVKDAAESLQYAIERISETC